MRRKSPGQKMFDLATPAADKLIAAGCDTWEAYRRVWSAMIAVMLVSGYEAVVEVAAGMVDGDDLVESYRAGR